MNSVYLYFTLCYPNKEILNSFLSTLSSSTVKGVEFGFPSTDPHYDGPVIRKTHTTSINCSQEEFTDSFRTVSEIGLKKYALSYYSDREDTFADFLEYLRINEFDGLIIPDIIVDYFNDYIQIMELCKNSGLELIPFVNASTPDSVLKEITVRTDSWIYFGLQPSTGISMPFDLTSASRRIRNMIGNRELICGFGIRNADQIPEIREAGADGIALGTMLVPYLENNDLEGFHTLLDDIRRFMYVNS